MPTTIRPWVRWALRLPLPLYEHGLGGLLGHRFLRLTHVGRRSGRRYQTVLEVLSYDPSTAEVVVLSGLGPDADWLRNVRATGTADVTIGRRSFHAAVRTPASHEAAAMLAAYERRNRIVVPVIRRVLSRLLGWHYDGTSAARDRLVRQLPVIAFRPLGDAATTASAAGAVDGEGDQEADGGDEPGEDVGPFERLGDHGVRDHGEDGSGGDRRDHGDQGR
jgi:deazaflavin-dependent oxidoreductase (nitroreductase family)